MCDIGASISAIPFTLYQEIMHDIAPSRIEDMNATIKLANHDTISSLGFVRDVEVLCGKVKYPTDFLVLGSKQDKFRPIVFGRPFLNTVNVEINCAAEKVKVSFGNISHEFNFSNFRKQPHEKELPSKDEMIGLASIVVPPTNPLEQYFLDHENDLHLNEMNKIDRILLDQQPILKHNLLVEILGDPPPPKGDHVFELKDLPNTLK